MDVQRLTERQFPSTRLPSTIPIRRMVLRLVGFSFREGNVKEYRVTKHDPALRGPNGEYKRDDWTMFSQISQTFRALY
jgi:hypothetical protein